MVAVRVRAAPSPLRVALVAGSLVGLVLVAIAIIRYPASTQQTILYVLAAGLLVLTGLVALLAARPRTAEGAEVLRLAALFGPVIGALWGVEILAGNLIATDSDVTHLVYRAATLLGFTLPLAAGFVGAYRTGRARCGLAVGFWSGLLSGLIGFLTLMLITYAFMDALRHDPQTLRAYKNSTERTLEVFVVGDSLFAACSHLAIVGAGWCTLLGGIGGLLGALAKRRL